MMRKNGHMKLGGCKNDHVKNDPKRDCDDAQKWSHEIARMNK